MKPILLFSFFLLPLFTLAPTHPVASYELPAIAYEWVEPETVSETPEPVASTTPPKPKDGIACSCVRYAHHLDPRIPLVDAKYFASFKLSGAPTLGSFAIFKYTNNYHIAKVARLNAYHFVVREANFKECEIGSREVDYNDEHLLGFFFP